MSQNVTAIVLAAGLGKRMKSPKPKVLAMASGLPMIEFVLRALRGAQVQRVRMVVGHGSQEVTNAVRTLGHRNVEFYIQEMQLGTADAVKAASPRGLKGLVLICNGDHPLIRSEDFSSLLENFRERNLDLGVVTTDLKEAGSFGRIVRNSSGQLVKIVEAKDASEKELKIREVNTGVYVVRGEKLADLVEAVRNNNKQNEYYLTDIIEIAMKKKLKVDVIKGSKRLSFGVNKQAELAKAARILRKRKLLELMEDGVCIIDPLHTYVEPDVQVGEGTTLYPGVWLAGKTEIGRNCIIENNVSISNCQVDDEVHIKWGSVLEATKVGSKALVGPYARLRPQTEIGEEAHVGNFVEMKKVRFGKKAKANHLTYLGDADIGEETNIGCGAITCNYAVDRKKYKTTIGKRAFIGSDTQFVAPVTVGDDAVVASGSTITKDVPSGALAFARARQVNKEKK